MARAVGHSFVALAGLIVLKIRSINMGISVTQLSIILVIVVVLFGTKRLRNIGGDLGGAIKGFRSAVKEVSSEMEELKEPATQENANHINIESTLKNAE